MKIKKLVVYSLILVLGINIHSQLVFADNEVRSKNVSYELDVNNKMMGLHPMTEAELQLKEEISILSKEANLNDLALERINQERKANGMPEVSYDTVEFGEETITEESEIMLFSEKNSILPEKVDNMVDKKTANCFPDAGDQGSFNSCGAFSSTYYQMTYMNALAKGYDVKNDSSKILSPKFTYNIGKKTDNAWDGIWPITAYDIVKKHGCPFNSDFPYSDDYSNSNNYSEWPTKYEIWERALYNKVKECGNGYIGLEDEKTPVTSPDDDSLTLIKTYLTNGYVLNVVTYYDAWGDQKKLTDGRFLCTEVCNDGEMMHAMTVVGYDDTVWYDINENGKEDAGEFGAFKIINSYGFDDVYETWFAYDALNAVSSVNASESDRGRQKGWVNNNEFTWVTMYNDYHPKLLAKFNITTNNRGDVNISLGYSDILSSNPIKDWEPYIFTKTKYENFTGSNSLSVGGSKNEETAEIVLDYTDLIDSQELDKIDSELKWYLSSNATISNFEIVDVPFDKHYTVSETLPNDSGLISEQAQLPLKVSEDKIWNISANYPLNTDTINSDNMRIKEKDNVILLVNISIRNGTNVSISPVTKYKGGNYYTLEIDGLKTLAGNGMGTPVRKNFFVPEYPIEAEFTDANFLNAVREIIVKTNGEHIYPSNLKNIKELDVSNSNITNLAGIEYFTSLEKLNCSHNKLQELDLSSNINLKALDVSYNALKTLDLSHNSMATEVNVDDDVIVMR